MIFIIDASWNGHRRKYVNELLANFDCAEVHTVGCNFFSILFFCLTKWIRLLRGTIIFTTGDPFLPYDFIIRLLNIRAVYITHRFSRYSRSKRWLLKSLRHLNSSSIFLVNGELIPVFRESFQSAEVLYLTDPLNQCAASILGSSVQVAGEKSIGIIGRVDCEQVEELFYAISVNDLGFRVVHSFRDGRLVVNSTIKNYTPLQESLITDLNFFSRLAEFSIFWAYKKNGDEYFSSTAIEALALGVRVIIHDSAWARNLMKQYVGVAVYDGNPLKLSNVILSVCVISDARMKKQASQVVTDYSGEKFINGLKLKIK